MVNNNIGDVIGVADNEEAMQSLDVHSALLKKK